VNLLGDNIDTIKKSTETLIDASKEVGLEINIEKSKCMLLSHRQDVGQNRDIRIANRSFENVSQSIYRENIEKTKRMLLSHRQDVGQNRDIRIANRSFENVSQLMYRENIEKTKRMLLSHRQDVGQNRDIRIANRSFENVSQFKYFGTTVTNQNLIQEEIKRRKNYGNACYHSAQNLLSSRLLSKNLKIRIYKTIILPVVLYGCETWSLILREEHRLRVFGPKRDEVM
jgi:hypothetical protein